MAAQLFGGFPGFLVGHADASRAEERVCVAHARKPDKSGRRLTGRVRGSTRGALSGVAIIAAINEN